VLYNLINDNMPTRIVFLTGLPRAGKTFFSEYFGQDSTDSNLLIDDTLDCFINLFKFKRLESETFLYLLEYTLKKICYEYNIGRRVNFRPNDQSSFLNSSNLKSILKNLNQSDKILEKTYLEKNFKSNLILLHSALSIAPDLIKLIPNTKIINIFDNPYSLAFSWIKSGYGNLETYSNQRVSLPLIDYKSYKLPIYCSNWENEFLESSEIERVVKMIYILFKKDEKGFNDLSQNTKSQIQMLSYEKILKNYEDLENDLLNSANIYQKKEKFFKMRKDIKKRNLTFDDEIIKRQEIERKLSEDLRKKINFCYEIYQNWKLSELQLSYK